MMNFVTSVLLMALTPSRAFTARSLVPLVAATPRFLASSPNNMPYDDDKMPFYALGTNIARQVADLNLKSVLEEDELEVVLDAFCSNIRGTALQDARTVLSTYGQELNALLQDRTSRIADRAKKEGEAMVSDFLKDNPTAMKTDSGLVYCETRAGTGASPTIDSTVEVHYNGTLTDGTVVDSSVDRGETFSVPLNKGIKGWVEGLQLMREGGKANFVVPSDLAYGDAGSGEVVPPGATLEFEVELIKVENEADYEEATEGIELPDGTRLRVPKGVKVRMVDEE